MEQIQKNKIQSNRIDCHNYQHFFWLQIRDAQRISRKLYELKKVLSNLQISFLGHILDNLHLKYIFRLKEIYE